jgi:hypothetical protein
MIIIHESVLIPRFFSLNNLPPIIVVKRLELFTTAITIPVAAAS